LAATLCSLSQSSSPSPRLQHCRVRPRPPRHLPSRVQTRDSKFRLGGSIVRREDRQTDRKTRKGGFFSFLNPRHLYTEQLLDLFPWAFSWLSLSSFLRAHSLSYPTTSQDVCTYVSWESKRLGSRKKWYMGEGRERALFWPSP
jgi:hypothetical protein